MRVWVVLSILLFSVSSWSRGRCESLFSPPEKKVIVIANDHAALLRDYNQINALRYTQFQSLHDYNEFVLDLTRLCNAALDLIIRDTKLLTQFGNSLPTVTKERIFAGRSILAQILLDVGIERDALNALVLRRLEMEGLRSEKQIRKPIGFIWQEIEDNVPNSTRLRIGFETTEPPYQTPYGRENRQVSEPQSGKRHPIGFLRTTSPDLDSEKNSPGPIGFDVVDRRFVDDPFLYELVIDMSTGEFDMVKTDPHAQH